MTRLEYYLREILGELYQAREARSFAPMPSKEKFLEEVDKRFAAMKHISSKLKGEGKNATRRK